MYRLPKSFIYYSRLYSITREARRLCSHVQKVQVSSNDEDELMKISFNYSNPRRSHKISLKVLKDHPIDYVLTQIKQVMNLQHKKEKIRQVVYRKYSSEALTEEFTEEEEDLEIALVHRDRQLDGNTKNIDAWTNGASLKIGSEQFEVDHNRPKVLELTLPEYILSDCYIRVHVMLECCTIEDSDFTWYRSIQNEASDSEDSYVEESAVVDMKWEKVHEGFMYKVSPDDVGHKLMVVCNAKRDGISGATDSCISKNAVLPAPRMLPFEKRHLYTKELADSDCIRCLTYNVLANCYVETRKFPYCTRKARDSHYRKQLMIRELLGYNSDIICLQEVQQRVFQYDLLPIFQKFDFDGCFERKGKRRFEGVATFYRTTKFKAIDQRGVHLSELVRRKEIGNDLLKKVAGNFKDMSRLLAQDTVLQVTLLEHLHQPSHRVLVANTHLYSNKDMPEVRLIQSALCTYYTEQFLEARKDTNQTALIFCGDFNSLPDSPAHKFILNGAYECCPSGKNSSSTGDTDRTLRHNLSFDSAYGTPKYTNYTEEFSGCLDYIFYSKNNLSVAEIVPLPRHEDVTREVALPSELFPSDHLALVCTLKWKHWEDECCIT